jgi:hypothetical protein
MLLPYAGASDIGKWCLAARFFQKAFAFEKKYSKGVRYFEAVNNCRLQCQQHNIFIGRRSDDGILLQLIFRVCD